MSNEVVQDDVESAPVADKVESSAPIEETAPGGEAEGAAPAEEDGPVLLEAELVEEDEDGIDFLSEDDESVEVIDITESELELEPEPEVEPELEIEIELEPEPEPNPEVEQLKADNEALAKEVKDLKNRLVRTAADFDNFRKRSNKERDDVKKFSAEKVVVDFLPIVDNLERALIHAGGGVAEEVEEAEEKAPRDGLVDGVRMVLKQFKSSLARHGVVGFDSLNTKFDPERHEAIQQVETTEHPTGTIVNEFQRGYHIHDRLLRPALVVVAKNPDDE